MITRIAIRHYRSLDVDFTLEPVTVIIGRSGTGKSNLISAIRFLRNALAPDATIVPNNLPEHSVYSITKPKDEPVMFCLEFSLAQGNKRYRYEISFKKQDNFNNQNVINNESLSLDDCVLFSRQGNKWIVEPKILQKPQINYTNLVLPTIFGIQEISIAHLLLTRGMGCYDFPGDVCAKKTNTSSESLLDHADNCAEVFSRIRNNLTRLNDWKEIIRALSRLNPAITSVDITPQENKLIVSHGLGEKVFTLDIARESEGFRRFFAHLLAIYQTPAKQHLFFEEPEKGIHPGALATLAEEFNAAPKEQHGQVILTTHNPELLNHFAPECIRVAEMRDHVTRIGPVADEQLSALKEELMKPGELLTVDPARLNEEFSNAAEA